MNETAVEKLFHQLWDTPKDKFTWYALLKQAKEMEREQHKQTYSKGYMDCDDYYDFETFFNETYGGNK